MSDTPPVNDPSSAAVPDAADAPARRGPGVPVIAATLAAGLAATLVLLRGDLDLLLGAALYDAEAAHLLAFPLLAWVVLRARRDAIESAPLRPSLAGPVLVVLGVLLFAATSWPLNFNQIRLLSIVPIAAGVLLSIGGFGLLRPTLPVLILLTVGIGVGSRYLIKLTAKPTAITADLSAGILSRIPGVDVTVTAGQLEYVSTRGDSIATGVVALGDGAFGSAFLMPATMLACFVVLARPRPLVHAVPALAIGGLCVLFGNLVRVLVVGAWTILADASPLAAAPRFAGPLAMLLLVWGGTAGGLWVMRTLLPVAGEQESKSAGGATGGRGAPARIPRTAQASLGLLAALAVAVPPVLGAVAARYEKEGVDLVRPFAELDRAALAPWELDVDLAPVSEAEEAWIGADEVLTAVVTGGSEDASMGGGAAMLLTYFRDPTEAVTHTPEFCYLRAGCEQLGRREVAMPEAYRDLAPRAVEVEIRTAADVRLVTYVFWHDGRAFLSRESLRLARFLPGDRESYYAKIEVAQPFDPDAGPEARRRASRASLEFLGRLLRELDRAHFPET